MRTLLAALCLAVMALTLSTARPIPAPAHASAPAPVPTYPPSTGTAGLDPVYARLTTAQKRVYRTLVMVKSDVLACYGLGSTAYSAYRAWLVGVRPRGAAASDRAYMRQVCTWSRANLMADTKDPLFKTRALYHALVVDGLVLVSYEDTLAYVLAQALGSNAPNTVLRAEIDTTVLQADSASTDFARARTHYRARYGY